MMVFGIGEALGIGLSDMVVCRWKCIETVYYPARTLQRPARTLQPIIADTGAAASVAHIPEPIMICRRVHDTP